MASAADIRVEFVQPHVDLAISLDTSPSMATDWTRVHHEFTSLAKALEQERGPLRLALGNPGGGGSVRTFLPAGYPAAVPHQDFRKFVDNVVPTQITDDGPMTVRTDGEAARSFLVNALSSPMLDAMGGFFDADSYGLVLVVTDEEDSSHSPDVATFLDWLTVLKSTRRYLSYSAVLPLGTDPPGCAQYTDDHQAAIAVTGGRIIPFCSPEPWSDALVSLVADVLATEHPLPLPEGLCAPSVSAFESGHDVITACPIGDLGGDCIPWRVDERAVWVPLAYLEGVHAMFVVEGPCK